MSKHFLEIQKGDFVASEKNKVNDVNLIIEEQGQIISLLGPSGIGKTTILRTLAGLQKLSSGKIYLKGKLIVEKKTTEQLEKEIKEEVPREKKAKNKIAIIFSLLIIIGITIYYFS